MVAEGARQLTVGSLFAGIGGFDLGFERAGYEIVWQVEIDEYCRRVLERHFPRAERFGDIRECCGYGGWAHAMRCPVEHHLKPVDVICGGFPCQPFSSAGRRAGTADDRYLWPEMLRIISALRPNFILAENVAGLIAMEDGRILDQVYDSLEAQDYETLPPLVIPACAFGAGHRRDRIWILAHSLRSSRSAEQEQQQEEWAEELVGVGSNAADSQSLRWGMGDAAHEWTAARKIYTFADEGEINGESRLIADSECSRLAQSSGSIGNQRRWPINAGEDAGNSSVSRLPDWAGGEMGQPFPLTEFERPSGREIERDFRGMAHGVSRRVDRLKGLGNAIVPQIAQWIAERIKLCLNRE